MEREGLGVDHDWFEGRGPKCCLMNLVDDATGVTDSFLVEQETTEAAMNLLWAWILRYGIPQALYCDRKNAFVIDRECYQILKDNKPRPLHRDKVIVRRWLDGSVHFFFKNKELLVKEYILNQAKDNASPLSA